MLSTLLVSGHEFIGINSFLFIGLVLVCLLLGGIIKRYNFHYLPESGASMLFGLICGGILNLTSDDEKSVLEFNANLIFFVILPPIILDAGYTLKRKDFFQNLGTILSLAIFGTVINNIVFGYLLYGFAKLEWIPLDNTSPLECLLFGAVISATDPVATLAMLGSKEVNAHPLLYSLVFGESVLNDAVAIVLYKTFENALPSESDDPNVPNPVEPFGVKDLLTALGTFLGVSIGSVIIGVSVALGCCFIFKKIDFSTMPVYEFTLVALFAYSSYFLAEIAYLSGIMSLFFCSICLAHYNYYNISTNAQISTQGAFKSVAQICETFVFAYIGITAGLSIYTSHLKWSFAMIVITIICCLIARACNVFPLCTMANLKRTGNQRIPFKMQIPLWFAGLRGAVAFALCLSFPGENVKFVVSSTLMLVLFTTIVGGGLTLPLLKWSGMSRGNAHSGSSGDSGEQEFELLANGDDASAALHAQGEEESKQNNNHAQLVQDEDGGFIPASDGPSEAQRSPYTGLVGRFKRFDKQVMRRIFGGAEAARGVNTGVIDDYGAPIPQQGEEADVRSFVMVSLSHNHRVDPETAHLPHQHPGSSPGSGRGSITGTGNGGLPAAGRPARNGGESISPNVSEDHYSYPRGKRTAPPAHPHPAQLLQSYRQDEDELKSIFKSSASTPSSGSHVVYPASVATSQLSGSAYQPPVFSPHTDTLQPSPLPTSALMKDSSSPPGTASGLEDPEQL